MLLGASVTYLALQPQLPGKQPVTARTGASPTAGNVSMPVPNPAPASQLPSPGLTAGQSPAQVDRTLGNFFYDHQNWAQAISHYEAAIRQGSDDADIRTDLGNAYRFTDRPDDALAQYTGAQQMNPEHEFSLFNQGGLYLEDLHDPTKAIEIWREYLSRFPRGRNVAAARQLIAQAQSGATGLTMPPSAPTAGDTAGPTAPTPSSSAEDLIMQQILSGRPKTTKP